MTACRHTWKIFPNEMGTYECKGCGILGKRTIATGDIDVLPDGGKSLRARLNHEPLWQGSFYTQAQDDRARWRLLRDTGLVHLAGSEDDAIDH